jgi:7-cyano-7-deazaguanine synthase
MLLLSIAAGYSESHRIGEIYYGAQAQDEYGYWDCTPDFVERINALLGLNRDQAMRVHAPFVGLAKADVVKLGLELGVDYGHTWTCYRGGQVPCGACPSCVERRKAFEAANAVDPLVDG